MQNECLCVALYRTKKGHWFLGQMNASYYESDLKASRIIPLSKKQAKMWIDKYDHYIDLRDVI